MTTEVKRTSSGLNDVYRTSQEPDPPCCPECLVPMVFDVMWTHWLCRSCGDCDCPQKHPREPNVDR